MVFWIITSCCLERGWHFRGAICRLLLLVSGLLLMEAVCPSETLDTLQTTQKAIYSSWTLPLGHDIQLIYFISVGVFYIRSIESYRQWMYTVSPSTVKHLSIVPASIVFPDPSFNFYGPWANPISTMAPASIVFLDPLFLFQTPDKNDE
jgi:hypothetical protein